MALDKPKRLAYDGIVKKDITTSTAPVPNAGQSTAARDYIACALWSSTAGDPLDRGNHELSSEASAALAAICDAWFSGHAKLISEAAPYWSDEQLAHDLWLTQNGHGAGFWDRACSAEDLESRGEIARLGARLTEAAKTLRPVDLYIGDDGLIYAA